MSTTTLIPSHAVEDWLRIEVNDDLDHDGDLPLYPRAHTELLPTLYLSPEARQQLREIMDRLDNVGTERVGYAPNGESFNEAVIALAITHERVISFQYQKAGENVIENRHLVPTQIIESSGDHKIVVGYDRARENPRAFRLDRILGSVAVSG